MHVEPAPLAVGLIGVPGLADPLRRAGFRVVTGDGFLGAATAIKRVVDGGTALPFRDQHGVDMLSVLGASWGSLARPELWVGAAAGIAMIAAAIRLRRWRDEG